MKKTIREELVKIEEYQCESCGTVYPNETYIVKCAACGKDICKNCLEEIDVYNYLNIHLLMPSLSTNNVDPYVKMGHSRKSSNEGSDSNKTFITIKHPYLTSNGKMVLSKYNKIICKSCLDNWNHWGKKNYNKKLDELVINFNEELQHINDQILSEIGSPDLDD